ncbi:hypothetical protein [Sporobacter termitidis]|uniref:hypothetical protein n=1 Tax=Sporobacter termitidis TaxID=44749 RepID=UPI000932F89D|nr:hypothetical protein [Sporobacter termitidis]
MYRTLGEVLTTDTRLKRRAGSAFQLWQPVDPKPLTFPEIVDIDRRIGELISRAERDKRPDRDRLYASYKRDLMRLVGWYAEDRRLKSSSSYATVIDALCEALHY